MSESVAMNDFCDQLKKLIEASGMTVCAAAQSVGLDPGNLSRILNGKERVTIERAEKIANAFGGTLSIKLKKRNKISAA
jgi:transcriptional regulator with XRE-family HTH domain